ncbi:MAG: hypothetical protein ACOCUZ_02135 [bacterium]
MDARRESAGGSTLLKGLFYLISVLVLASLGYTGWIVAIYWGRVGV